MKKLFPLVLLFSSPFLSYSQKVITGVPSPESIIAYKDGYFVSSIGQKLAAVDKDGDGAIAFVDKAGNVKSQRYFDEVLNAPKGIDIVNNQLYVADIDHLKGFDIATKKKIFDLNLEGKAQLLNDVYAVNDSLLFVTDSFTGDVLQVNLSSGQYKSIGTVTGANGVLFDKKSGILYVCSMGEQFNAQGKLYSKKLSDHAAAFAPVEGSPVGLFDGIVQVDDQRIILSDWQGIDGSKPGNLVTYHIGKKSYTRKEVKHSPADIAIDKKARMLLVPRLLDGEIDVAALEK